MGVQYFGRRQQTLEWPLTVQSLYVHNPCKQNYLELIKIYCFYLYILLIVSGEETRDEEGIPTGLTCLLFCGRKNGKERGDVAVRIDKLQALLPRKQQVRAGGGLLGEQSAGGPKALYFSSFLSYKNSPFKAFFFLLSQLSFSSFHSFLSPPFKAPASIPLLSFKAPNFPPLKSISSPPYRSIHYFPFNALCSLPLPSTFFFFQSSTFSSLKHYPFSSFQSSSFFSFLLLSKFFSFLLPKLFQRSSFHFFRKHLFYFFKHCTVTLYSVHSSPFNANHTPHLNYF